MAKRNIRLLGDEILNRTAKEVKEMTVRNKILVKDMLDTMYDAQGVGLAAPQVGILKRIVVIDVSIEANSPIVLVNPVIIQQDGEQTGDEGCLSVPGKVGIVTRPNHVIVEAFNENMEKITIEGTELLARALCHEIDHLDGHLYTEKVEGQLYDTKDLEEKENEKEKEIEDE